MKQIALTQGQFALVDDEDYERLSRHKWYAWWNKYTRSYYAFRQSPRSDGKQQLIRMHREILGLERGDKRRGDHRDGDTLNNQRANLRTANLYQNARNARKKRNNTSGYKGVWRNKQCGKWQAAIRVASKRIHLGLYDTPEAAHHAYCKAAVEHYGEFARMA